MNDLSTPAARRARILSWVGQDGLFDARSPLRIESLRDVVVVTAGWAHTCARRRDGTMWCWGANDVGQLGNGLPEHPAQGFAVRW